MFGLTSCLRLGRRERLIGFMAAVIIGLVAWLPSAAHAVGGCEDSWTNTAGGSWFEGTNWSKGKAPASEEEACVTANGTYTVTMDQTSTVTVKALTVGGTSGTQTLVVASTNGTNAVLTTSAGIVNNEHGAITLTNAETNGNNVTVVGPVTNAGTITSEPAKGGQRNLQGNLTNTGTLAINANTSFNGSKATLTASKGAIDIASGVQLVASSETSVKNSGGKIAATGSGDVLMEPGTSFTEGAGTTSGTKPVILRNAALKYTGTGKSLITQHGEGNTLSGNLAAGQSLVLESTNGEHTKATASASFSNAGTITLTKIESNNNNARLAISSGTLTNTGTITSEAAEGTGHRFIEGSVTNTGTLNINSDTEFDTKEATLTNEGTLNLATSAALIASSETSIVNAAGSINGAGTGAVAMEPGTTFTEGAGTTSGTKPVILRQAALKYTGSGKSLITQHGEGSTLSGNLSSGQSLVLESTNGEDEKTTASASFSNAGSITLTKSESNDNNARLAISSGTLTNTGTITSEAAEGTGHRFIEGSVTNTGTLNINSDTEFDSTSALLTNEGALNVATGAALFGSSETSVANAAGSINGTGTGAVQMEPGTSFTQGAGATSGTKPVILRDAALVYTGTGESKITQHGEGSTLSGNLAAGQSLVLESTNSEDAKTTASASFTNAGSITLTKIETNNNNARLAISSGTLTNTGTITSEAAESTGHRFLEGSITNKGTLNINSDTEYNGSKAALINEGALNVAEGATLDASNESSVMNGTGGKIVAGLIGNVVVEPGGTFTEGAGTTSGTKPVILRDAALHYTGTGESKITQHGEGSTLSGNLAAGQSLVLESTNSEHAKTTASASFTNAGSITLTKSESNDNNARLAISSGTLTNTGTITSEAAEGTGHRFIEGSITNKGTLNINSDTEFDTKEATLTNEGALNLAEEVTFSVLGNATVNNNGGMITGTGNGMLSQTGGTFNEGSGTTTSGEPVILHNTALRYMGKGASTIVLRGEGSMLKGTISNGQTLSIQSTCSSHAKTTASGSFTNYGVITLTNGDSCGNNVTFDLGGNTLTNKNTIKSENPHGGSRTIEGALINEATLALSAGETLKVTATYTQTSKGKLRVLVASATSFGALSVSGSATIAGTLVIRQVPPFKASLGQTFAALSSASLTGTFATETNDQINSTGLYYKPTYSATGLTLVVEQATLVLSAASGVPGSTVTISGSGYLPGDTITPTFTDHKKVKTTFPSVTTNGSGEFSTEITIPASAALKAGSISVTSAQTGVTITKTFTVISGA